ncbi:MAG TPA: response regulator [Trinickia sp.]|uniref:response regulator n=1 Tax=Trinickia sp. TaxID=2571163 RepID=UPI002B6CFB39|nr:response regulator [Trinickia sp.]HTI18231.1 response regulator [Trinickia sp.]
MIRVVIADDHPVILLGARHALARFPDMEVVGEARQSTDLVKLLSSVPCDVVVTDLAMPGGVHGDGLPLISYVQRHFPMLPIVVLTMLENTALIRRLGEMGVVAIVSKSDDLAHIGLAVRHVVHGLSYAGPSVRALREAFHTITGRKGRAGQNDGKEAADVRLSPREIEVVRLFASGLTVKEMAERLKRSIKTVSSHKTAALRKLGLERDSELFQYAQSTGLIHLSSPEASREAAR